MWRPIPRSDLHHAARLGLSRRPGGIVMQGCICPHPPLLIPEVGGNARGKIAATVTAMERLAASVGDPTPSSSSRRTRTTSAPRTRSRPPRACAATSAASAVLKPRSATTTTCSSRSSCWRSPATAAAPRRARRRRGARLGRAGAAEFLRPNRIVIFSVVGPYGAPHARTTGAALRGGTGTRHAVPRLRRPLAALIHGAPAP